MSITLESNDADTYLYLRAGEARSGEFLYENDDYPEAGDTDKSQIQETLAAGSYTIEATTYSAGETGSFTLTVSGLGTTGATPPGPEPTDRVRPDLVARRRKRQRGRGLNWCEQLGLAERFGNRGYARHYGVHTWLQESAGDHHPGVR